MASEKLGSVSAPQNQSGHTSHHQLVFSESFASGTQPPHRRPIAVCDPGPKAATRELTSSFLDHHPYFQPPSQPVVFRHQWNASSRSSGGDGSDDDEDDEHDDDDEDDDDINLENIVTAAKFGGSNQNEMYSSNSNCQNMKHITTFGMKEGNVGQSRNDCNNDNNDSGEMRDASGGEMHYTQYLKGPETGPSSSSAQKDIVVMENGCEFSGRKEASYISEPGESLRTILSDPLTGLLMDDAVILPCGHSFGSGGVQQVVRIKLCCICSQPVSEDSIAPNLSLRLAVQAFMREEELQVNRTPKRRRERYDPDKASSGDPVLTDHLRGRGVQFPFAVTDRVIIKGNKRTPQRFVGREAIVTAQCLNGWYVVKTLDNAESVKLQYRSLAKVAENPSSLANVAENPSSRLSPIKMTPNWL